MGHTNPPRCLIVGAKTGACWGAWFWYLSVGTSGVTNQAVGSGANKGATTGHRRAVAAPPRCWGVLGLCWPAGVTALAAVRVLWAEFVRVRLVPGAKNTAEDGAASTRTHNGTGVGLWRPAPLQYI